MCYAGTVMAAVMVVPYGEAPYSRLSYVLLIVEFNVYHISRSVQMLKNTLTTGVSNVAAVAQKLALNMFLA